MSQDVWNGAAASWERQADQVDAHLVTATDLLLDAAGIGDGDDVLDVAAGPGGAGLTALARVGATGSVTISDVAEAMVAAARRRAGGQAQLRWLVCDQASIAADAGSFDAVISRHGLMFADDPVAAVTEAVRVLRPSGRYAAMTWGPRAENPWLGLVLDAVGEQFGMTLPPPGVPGPFALDDAETLGDVLRRGGLSDVTVSWIATPFRAPSAAAWWDRVTRLAGPLEALLDAMEPDARSAIRDRALASAPAAAADGLTLGGSCLIAAGCH